MLDAVRRGERPALEVIHGLGEECPSDFFRLVVEPLADSFDESQAEAYRYIMQPWKVGQAVGLSTIPRRMDTVYVLSRVTLGADIKIVSPILDAMKKRFPKARLVFVANKKSGELFDIPYLEANYPRTGPVSERIAFAHDLRCKLQGEHRIVVDPDSRMTQLGLIPVCEPANYFHFPSRTIGGDSAENLSSLVNKWLKETFGQTGQSWIAVKPVPLDDARPRAAVSFGVGENETKRISGDFEASLLRKLLTRFRTVWIDRGVGGEEARRVTAAAEAAGAVARIRFWEGSFAGFASIIEQSDLYVGYDSAGQHAAAAVGTSFLSIFAGAPSDRFRDRWAPVK